MTKENTLRTARVLGLAALAGGQTRTIEIERLPPLAATAFPGEMPLGTGADRVEDTDIQNDVE